MSLIVLEGLDGSGKGTQTRMLAQQLRACGVPVRTITFPNYDSPSSALVKMYLSGAFGKDADSVNAYAASSFYAVDRFASFRMDWQQDYEAGTLILADRYVTSNMVFQMGKLPREDWENFARWLDDFEYGKMGLPGPTPCCTAICRSTFPSSCFPPAIRGTSRKKTSTKKTLRFWNNAGRAPWRPVHGSIGR